VIVLIKRDRTGRSNLSLRRSRTRGPLTQEAMGVFPAQLSIVIIMWALLKEEQVFPPPLVVKSMGSDLVN
jgi:hypothetical protein